MQAAMLRGSLRMMAVMGRDAKPKSVRKSRRFGMGGQPAYIVAGRPPHPAIGIHASPCYSALVSSPWPAVGAQLQPKRARTSTYRAAYLAVAPFPACPMHPCRLRPMRVCRRTHGTEGGGQRMLFPSVARRAGAGIAAAAVTRRSLAGRGSEAK